MLTGIQIENFSVLKKLSLGRTAEELRSGQGESRELSELTTLIGRNGTGKTAIFEALAFVRDIQLHGLPYAASGRRGGIARLQSRFHEQLAEGPMRFVFIFRKDPDTRLLYELCIGMDAHSRPYIASEKAERFRLNGEDKALTLLAVSEGDGCVCTPGAPSADVKLWDSKQSALSLYGRMLQYKELCWLYLQMSHWYVCRIDEQTQEQKYPELGGHKHLSERCDNVRNVLSYLQKEDSRHYERMIGRISSKIPDYKKLGDAFLDSGINTGNLKLFTYLLLLEDPRPLICLDEPDNGLYHDMIEALMAEMRDYSFRNEHAQIFLSTHNTTLLENLKPEEVWAMERDETLGGHARRVDDDPIVREMYKEGINMGMLWYGGHLGIN